jgi:hypothetical protein
MKSISKKLFIVKMFADWIPGGLNGKSKNKLLSGKVNSDTKTGQVKV